MVPLIGFEPAKIGLAICHYKRGFDGAAFVVPLIGFEPAMIGWAICHYKRGFDGAAFVVPLIGFEPTTPSLRMMCSTN
jgi:hypothetical protein